MGKYAARAFCWLMHIRDILAANIRRARAQNKMSQEALADAAGIDRTYISSIERCMYGVSIDKLAAIADALAMPAYELLKPLSGTNSLKKRADSSF